MKSKKTINYILFFTGFMGFMAIAWWFFNDPTGDFKVSLAGEDNRGKADSAALNVVIGEIFSQSGAGFAALNETWPRFRGADFDNISKSPVKLLDKFGSSGPKILWKLSLGEGHSGAAIYKGRAYVLDYDETERADKLRCLSLTDGKEIWVRGYRVPIKRNHGMSRTIPAITEKYIVTIGPMGHVMCLDRESGNMRWGLNLLKEYETELPGWYAGQCPLIDNDLAILAPAGKSLMVAVSCETGKIVWETPNSGKYKMAHSSIMPYTFSGRKMFVYSAVGGVVGVAADGGEAGKILWETTAWNHPTVTPSPVCMPDGKIFLSAGYGAGSMMLQLSESGGKFNVKVIDEYLPSKGLASEQQTPLFWKGHLLGIMPKDGGAYRNQLTCVSPEDTKKVIWSSNKDARFGLGPYFIADDKLFILDDEMVLTIVKPDTGKYIQLDQAKIMEGYDSWAPFALADGYLLLRDSKTMVCIDLKK